MTQENRLKQDRLENLSQEYSTQIQAEKKASEALLQQVTFLSTEVQSLREAVADTSALYFTALTLSFKLRAVLFGLPVSVDINSLLEEVNERTLKIDDWPRFISDRIFRLQKIAELNTRD